MSKKQAKQARRRLRNTSTPTATRAAPGDRQRPTGHQPEDAAGAQGGSHPRRDAPRPGWLLSLGTAVAVPNEIADLYQRFRAWDGIPPWMVGEAVAFGRVLPGERGAQLLYRSEQEGETADMFVGLARALSILSFVPAGVSFGEQRFDALAMLTANYGEEEARAFCQKALVPYFDAVVTRTPVACWSEGGQPIAFGASNAVHWFEQAHGDDLLQLRAQQYRGFATWVSDPLSRSGYAQRLLCWLFEQAKGRVKWSRSPVGESPSVEDLGDHLLLAACTASQEIAFQVDPGPAEAWLALYRHALLTGERWLLPPDSTKRQEQRSGHPWSRMRTGNGSP